MTKEKPYDSIPPKVAVLLERLKAKERKQIEEFLENMLENVKSEMKVQDLWYQPELTATYWILLITGVDQEEEMEIAKTLLTWRSFYVKDAAQVLCIQSSERKQYHFCLDKFSVNDSPVLLLSDTAEMKDFVKIEANLLSKLMNKKGGLRKFLNKIQLLIENGSLKDVKRDLQSEKFWSGLKLVYNEVKSLVSFNAGI